MKEKWMSFEIAIASDHKIKQIEEGS